MSASIDHLSAQIDAPRLGGDAELIELLATPVAEALGYEILLVEWAGRGGSRILRLYIDRPDGEGVGIEDCTRMSRSVSNALDAAEAAATAAAPIIAAGDVPASRVRAVLTAPYTLEVSSPGVDRPLTRLTHFERVLGQRVKIRTHEPPLLGEGRGAQQRTFYGRLDAVEPDPARPDEPRAGSITIVPEDHDEPLRLNLAQIQRANLVYEGI